MAHGAVAQPFGPGPAFVIETATHAANDNDPVGLWVLTDAPPPLDTSAMPIGRAMHATPLTIDVDATTLGAMSLGDDDSLDMIIEDYVTALPAPHPLPPPSTTPLPPPVPQPDLHVTSANVDEQRHAREREQARLRREFWNTLPRLLHRVDRFMAATLLDADRCAVCDQIMCTASGDDACRRGAPERSDASDCVLVAEDDCTRQLLAIRCRWNGMMVARDVWTTNPCAHAVHSACAMRILSERASGDVHTCRRCGTAILGVEPLLDSVVEQHRRAWLETGGGNGTAAVRVAQAMWVVDRWRSPPPRLTTAMIDEVATRDGDVRGSLNPTHRGVGAPARIVSADQMLGRMERAHALLEQKHTLLAEMRDALQRDDSRAFWIAAETLRSLAPSSKTTTSTLWERVEPPRDYRPNVDAAAAIVLQALIAPVHGDVVRWLDREGFMDTDTLRHLSQHAGAMAAIDKQASAVSRALLVRALARALLTIDERDAVYDFLAPWRAIVLAAPSEHVREVALAASTSAPRLLDNWRRVARSQGRWSVARALEPTPT